MNSQTITPDMSPDQKAAHQFLTDLRTRISTQSLPYQHGVEADALKSMWEVFAQARAAIKENPGCQAFADRTTDVLNTVVRPLTGKWHRAFEEGRLNGRDGADEFRGELQGVQEQLRAFVKELQILAYGESHEDTFGKPVMSNSDLAELLAPVAFGIPAPPRTMNDRVSGSAGPAGSGQPARIRAGNPAASPTAPDKHADAVTARINESEKHAVDARRRQHGLPADDGKDAIGLALSGGGIRSATFSLGVVQVLAEKGLLKEVDFLSTVSGGGYTGCFLTRRLGEGATLSDVAGPHGPDPDPVRYLRQRARFLSGDNLKERWSMVTATLAGMTLNWTVPLLVILVLALIATRAAPHFDQAWPVSFYGFAGLSALATLLYGWGMRQTPAISRWTGWFLGTLLAITLVVAAGKALDFGYQLFRQESCALLSGGWASIGGLTGILAALATAVPVVLRFVPVLRDAKVRRRVLQMALLLTGLLVPLAGLLLFYAFRWIAEGTPGLAVLGGLAVVCALISLFLININLTGPHRLYRDSLARTFIRRTNDDEAKVKLAEINPQGTAPVHLINATLNVPNSPNPALKDRGCDFFLFSRGWTGSTATGYHPTTQWKANGTDVDLATAMAVSGAAVSSHMGLGSMPSLQALLAVLNLRLGFWIRQPQLPGRWGMPRLKHPGFSALLREIFGFAMSEKARWLNLSDGGHLENLGVYELLRRRCKFIICVDGEADAPFAFNGLLTVVRHAQIDLGVRISPRLEDLRPDPATGFSKCHFHLCRIHYPAIENRPEELGLLLYLKLSVTGNESELITRYRRNHPDFPHQSTLDQFFDQEQFEAYRQLGVHVAETLFLPALMSGTRPTSIPAWFRQLAASLLEPGDSP